MDHFITERFSTTETVQSRTECAASVKISPIIGESGLIKEGAGFWLGAAFFGARSKVFDSVRGSVNGSTKDLQLAESDPVHGSMPEDEGIP